MKRLSIVIGICVSLLLGTAAIAAAQDEHRNDQQDNRQPNRQDQARPDDRRNQEPQAGDRRETTPQNEGRQEQQPQSGDRHPERQQDERQMQQPEGRQDIGQQHEREKDRHEQAPQPQRQGDEHARAEGRQENRRRISDSDFRAHFGRAHRFAPGRMQVFQGRPQFNYGGYVFEIIEVWPVGWAYDADDYYIDYMDDEYWLYSFDHPGVRLELIIIG